jgi:hypothetical protein
MLDNKIVIAKIKNNIAPGDDEVMVEMVKAIGPIGVQ